MRARALRGARTVDERRTEWARRARFDEVRREVAERVGRICGEMPTVDVDALIRRMTLVQLKYELGDPTRIN
jgi:hypothetical protein